jgi:uncharacterized delta-60 repeat protein
MGSSAFARPVSRVAAGFRVAAGLAVVAVVTCFLPAGAVLDPSGELDTAFDGDGHTVTNFAEVDTFAEARGIAFQTVGANAGRIVLAGGYQDGFNAHVALLRLNPDGTQDMGFGGAGETKTIIGNNDLAYDVAIADDDKIVVAGDSDQDFFVARYTPDGALDTTFGGGDGVARAGAVPGEFDRGHTVVIQPDGKILVGGYSWTSATTYRDLSVMRFTPLGDLDTSFGGGDGIATISVTPTNAERIWGLAVQPDGKIVGVGGVNNGNSTCNTVAYTDQNSLVMRLHADGSPDATFGGDGIVTQNLANGNCPDDSFRAIALAADGKIVTAGGAATTHDGSTNAKSNISAARFNPDGSFDTTFDTDGWTWTNIAPTSTYLADLAEDVAILGDGKILVGAYSDAGSPQGSNQNFAAVRFSPAGALDPTFDGDGKAVVDFGQNDSLDAMAVDTSGRPVLAGYSYPPGVFDDPQIAAARLGTDGKMDQSFNGTGSFFKPLQGGSVDAGYAVGVQRVAPNAGRVIVAGSTDAGRSYDFGLVRYTTNGTLDDTFSSDGRATGDDGTKNDTGRAVAIASDDKIVVAGDSYGTTAGSATATLMRFTANGMLDMSFSGEGVASTAVGSNANAWHAVTTLSDGKIVVGGTTSDTPADWDFFLARYRADGTLDTTFDGDGRKRLSLGPRVEEIRAVAVQPDGKILAGGFHFPDTKISVFALVRFNPDGSVDTSFGGGDGIVTTPIGGGEYARNELRAIVVLPDGKIVAGGKGNDGGGNTNNVMRLVRYLPDGALDPSFDGDGIATTNLASDRFDELSGLALQHDEKVVAFGHSMQLYKTNDDFVVARYNWDDGSLDATFGDGTPGYTITAVSAGADRAGSGVVLPGGGMVTGGTAGSSDFGAARYRGDPAPVLPGPPDLAAASDLGSSATDNVTNDATPTFTGAAPGCNLGETTWLRIGSGPPDRANRQLCRAGTWTITTVALTDGQHTLSAFSRNGFGDTGDTTSLAVTIDTVAAPPVITAPADGAELDLPGSPMITGTVAETLAGARVEVRNGADPLCTATADASGNWGCPTSLGAGHYTITARQTDVAGNTSSDSSAVDFTLDRAETTIAVSSSSNPSTYGKAVTFTVTVSAPTSTPPGSVEVTIGSAAPRTVTLTDGKATLDVGDLPTGTNAVKAEFAGDTTYKPGSGTLPGGQVVDKAASVLKLTSNPNPSAAGEAVTFTAVVEPASPGTPASATPKGSVEFRVDGGGPVTKPLSSPATFTTSALTAGTHTVTATYTGDANYATASATLADGQVVNAAPDAPGSPAPPSPNDPIGGTVGPPGGSGTGTGSGTTGTRSGSGSGSGSGGTTGVLGTGVGNGQLPRTGTQTGSLLNLAAALLVLAAALTAIAAALRRTPRTEP